MATTANKNPSDTRLKCSPIRRCMQVLFTSCLASFTDFPLHSLTLLTGDQIKCTAFFDKINIPLGLNIVWSILYYSMYLYNLKYNKGLVVCRHFKANIIHIISLNSQLSILLLLISSPLHTHQHTHKHGISGWMVRRSAQWSVGLHPLLSHPSSTLCESLLWPRHCEFDECSTSALLNHRDSVWEAPVPGSNGHCSTPLTHNHTYTKTHIVSLWRHTLDFGLFIHVYSPVLWRQTMHTQSDMDNINMSVKMEDCSYLLLI